MERRTDVVKKIYMDLDTFIREKEEEAAAAQRKYKGEEMRRRRRKRKSRRDMRGVKKMGWKKGFVWVMLIILLFSLAGSWGVSAEKDNAVVCSTEDENQLRISQSARRDSRTTRDTFSWRTLFWKVVINEMIWRKGQVVYRLVFSVLKCCSLWGKKWSSKIWISKLRRCWPRSCGELL